MDVFEAACACGEPERGKNRDPYREHTNHADEYNPTPQGAFKSRGSRSAGVGIVFQPDSSGALHVKSLAVGGPAESCLSGNVEVGDVLHEIDGHVVYRKPVAQLAPLILGQEGSKVRLGLKRGSLEQIVYAEMLRTYQASGATAKGQVASSSKSWNHPLPELKLLKDFPCQVRATVGDNLLNGLMPRLSQMHVSLEKVDRWRMISDKKVFTTRGDR